MEDIRATDKQATLDAITILRRAYEQTDIDGSDILFNARMYLADRSRYERIRRSKLDA